MSQFLSILLLVAAACYFIFICFQKVTGDSKLEKAIKRIGELEFSYNTTQKALEVKCQQFQELSLKFEKLQHQKISADVKLGQKSEVLLPFLEDFPYKDDEIKGLYQPIDLIVFRDEEVVFVEVKSGQSQLSQKQRQIRDNIKAGRVRFEVVRMSEKGIRVK